MGSLFPSLLFFLIILIPSILATDDECIPSLCDSACCATNTTCASTQSECNYCNPQTCDTGCCIENKCAKDSSECTKKESQALPIALMAVFIAIPPLSWILYTVIARISDEKTRKAEIKTQVKAVAISRTQRRSVLFEKNREQGLKLMGVAREKR